MPAVQLPPIEIILDVVEDDAAAAGDRSVEQGEPEDGMPRRAPEVGSSGRAGSSSAGSRPVTWGEYRAVTRRIHLPPGAVEWFRTIPAGTEVEVARRPLRLVRFDGPCTVSRRGHIAGWRRPGRIVVHGWQLVRYTRIDIELLPWSPSDAELRVVPRSHRLARWGLRRRRRYFDVAHDAGDALRVALAPAVRAPANEADASR